MIFFPTNYHDVSKTHSVSFLSDFHIERSVDFKGGEILGLIFQISLMCPILPARNSKFSFDVVWIQAFFPDPPFQHSTDTIDIFRTL